MSLREQKQLTDKEHPGVAQLLKHLRSICDILEVVIK